MTRQMKLSRQEVYFAADQIKALGRNVTPLKILSLLGGGRLTTIYKHLYAWQKSQSDKDGSDSVMKS
ncbi:MAG: DNA-binding protein [Cyanobacteria bacterium]|nr:DNA-binding protein [Cyanobacteriota bacterium]